MSVQEPHRHVDRGGGYCACGAERCSLPRCDAWCVHPGGWVEAAELADLRRLDLPRLLNVQSTMAEHIQRALRDHVQREDAELRQVLTDHGVDPDDRSPGWEDRARAVLFRVFPEGLPGR